MRERVGRNRNSRRDRRRCEIGGKEDYEEYGNVEMHEVFSRYHNSIVGHLDVDRTLKAMSLGGYAWVEMRKNVSQWIDECIWYLSEDQISA